MDQAELHAKAFLGGLGFTDVIFEPDGNVPPDFALDGRIAVEVRRLHHIERASGSEARGTDESWIPLYRRVSELCDQLSKDNPERFWILSYSIKRPVQTWRSTRAILELWLLSLRNLPAATREHVLNAPSLTVTAYASTELSTPEFHAGIINDPETTGWQIPLLLQGVEHCLVDKTTKVAPYLSRYDEWWLVLIDQISYGVAEESRHFLRRHPISLSSFKRVVLVDPLNSLNYFDLPGS